MKVIKQTKADLTTK